MSKPLSFRHIGLIWKRKRTDSCLSVRRDIDAVIAQARKLANERSIKFPKQCGYGGCYGSDECMINFTTNAVRDILLEVLSETKCFERGGVYANTGI